MQAQLTSMKAESHTFRRKIKRYSHLSEPIRGSLSYSAFSHPSPNSFIWLRPLELALVLRAGPPAHTEIFTLHMIKISHFLLSGWQTHSHHDITLWSGRRKLTPGQGTGEHSHTRPAHRVTASQHTTDDRPSGQNISGNIFFFDELPNYLLKFPGR